ncbi:MAG: hypothetical protein WCD00_05140 [Desulfuromonadaceae bacterium]
MMKHTYHVKIFGIMLGIACFAFAPSVAFGGWVGETMCACPGLSKPLGNNASCEDACYGTRSSTGSGNATPSYDYGAAQQAREAEAERQRQAEAERIKRELELQAEEKRKNDEFIKGRDATVKTLKGSTGTAINQLKGISGTDDSGLKGSGFDTSGTGLKGLRGSDSVEDNRNEPAGLGGKSNLKGIISKPGRPAPHTDTSVVDARNVPSGLDKATENAIAKAYPNAPAGVSDRVRKGFQAVMERDWKVARAWFEDALNRDPGNPGLQRLVALADYSQQHVQHSINGKPFTDEDIPEDADPQTYAMTSTKIHSQRAWSKFLFPDGKNLRKAAPVFKKLPDGRVMQLPSESDILFMFPGNEPPASPVPAPKPTPTFIIGKDGQLIQVPENSDQESPTYIKGKDGSSLRCRSLRTAS